MSTNSAETKVLKDEYDDIDEYSIKECIQVITAQLAKLRYEYFNEFEQDQIKLMKSVLAVRKIETINDFNNFAQQITEALTAIEFVAMLVDEERICEAVYKDSVRVINYAVGLMPDSYGGVANVDIFADQHYKEAPDGILRRIV